MSPILEINNLFKSYGSTEILKDILKDTPKEEIDDKIVTLKRQVKNESVQDIAKTSAVKNVTKYLKMMDKGCGCG